MLIGEKEKLTYQEYAIQYLQKVNGIVTPITLGPTFKFWFDLGYSMCKDELKKKLEAKMKEPIPTDIANMIEQSFPKSDHDNTRTT